MERQHARRSQWKEVKRITTSLDTNRALFSFFMGGQENVFTHKVQCSRIGMPSNYELNISPPSENQSETDHFGLSSRSHTLEASKSRNPFCEWRQNKHKFTFVILPRINSETYGESKASYNKDTQKMGYEKGRFDGSILINYGCVNDKISTKLFRPIYYSNFCRILF